MKTSHFIYALIAIGLFASWGQTTSQENFADTENQMPINSNNKMFANKSVGFQNNVQNTTRQEPKSYIQKEKKLVSLRDPASGMVIGSLPVPNSWNLMEGDTTILLQGPNRTIVYKEIAASFYYSSDTAMNDRIRKDGSIVKAPVSSEDLFLKEFKPMAEGQGNRLIAYYSVKEIADNDSRIDAMYYKPNSVNTMFQASVSEWEDINGNTSIVVIKHQRADYGTQLVNWGYTISSMESDPANFHQAKNDFLYALINYEVNPEYIESRNKNTRKTAAGNN